MMDAWCHWPHKTLPYDKRCGAINNIGCSCCCCCRFDVCRYSVPPRPISNAKLFLLDVSRPQGRRSIKPVMHMHELQAAHNEAMPWASLRPRYTSVKIGLYTALGGVTLTRTSHSKDLWCIQCMHLCHWTYSIDAILMPKKNPEYEDVAKVAYDKKVKLMYAVVLYR